MHRCVLGKYGNASFLFYVIRVHYASNGFLIVTVNSPLLQKSVYKRGLTGVPDQAYATAIGLFNSVINVILLIIANTTSKKFSENSLW
jgi:ABC-type polysaccharide transport system permease subunit